MNDKHTIKLYAGQEMLPLLAFVAETGMHEYKDYPYLYEADKQEVYEYLTWLSQLSDAVLAVAYAGNTPIGFALGTPLAEYSQKIFPQNFERSMEQFRRAGRDPARYYYITDDLVVAHDKKDEIRKSLFNSMEEYARQQLYDFICFAAETHEEHPLKPKDYVEPTKFWDQLGFKKTGLTFNVRWKTRGPQGPALNKEHELFYWTKKLPDVKDSVTIIGAGPAGLLAAYRLKKAGIPVRLYEARSRVGGRMFSDAERMIEFGPWSLGDGGNSGYIESLAHELGLELFSARMPFPGYMLKGDHFVSPNERFRECIADSKETRARLSSIIDSCSTLQDVLDRFFKDYPDLKHYSEMMSWVYHGSQAHTISAHLYKEGIIELCLGGVSDLYKHAEPFFPLYRIKGGNDLLAKKLAARLEGSIQLNKELIGIRKGTERKYALSFADGACEETDNVLLALPVAAYGNLKIEDDVIPAAQLTAISATNPGTVAKVLLPSQGNTLPSGFFVGDGFSAGITSDEKYLTLHWARPVDTQVIAEKIEALCKLLQWPLPRNIVMIDDAGVGNYPPDAALIVDWPHNPYTHGSYCSFSPAQDRLAGYEEIDGVTVQRLFKPAGTIYFAGEAASVTAATGSVGAAFESAEIAVSIMLQRREKSSIPY